jgi:hypothetical protein
LRFAKRRDGLIDFVRRHRFLVRQNTGSET